MIKTWYGNSVLAGAELAESSSYRYLGIELYNDLDTAKTLATKRKALEKSCEEFVNMGWKLPQPCKAMYLKAVVIPMFTYGMELLHTCHQEIKAAQVVLNTALRAAIGTKMKSLSLIATSHELNILRLQAIADISGWRLLEKAPSMKTLIAQLIANRPTGRQAD